MGVDHLPLAPSAAPVVAYCMNIEYSSLDASNRCSGPQNIGNRASDCVNAVRNLKPAGALPVREKFVLQGWVEGLPVLICSQYGPQLALASST